MGAPISRFATRDAFCYSRTRATDALFRGSSVVEQPAVNRLVVGSNPTRGAISTRSVALPNSEGAPDDRQRPSRHRTSVENMPTRPVPPQSYHRIPAGSRSSQTHVDSDTLPHLNDPQPPST